MAFEPRIIGFLCNWCAYSAADLAGAKRMHHAPNVDIIRVMCSGRIDPSFVLKAFREGADGVIVAGCHPGGCHYSEGNFKTLRRMPLLRNLLLQFGIEPQRLRLEWMSAAEASKWVHMVEEMRITLKELGPLDWQGSVDVTIG